MNGLRAALRKGAWDWLKTAGDVICLQEIRVRPEQIDPDWLERLAEAYPFLLWNAGARAGYSGTLTLSKQEPRAVWNGLSRSGTDREGRVTWLKYPSLTVANVYVPSGRRDHSRLGFKLKFYARLFEACLQLLSGGAQLVMGGDFNTAHNEIELHNPNQNRRTSGFLPEERAWIDRILAQGMVDIYRELHPTRQQFTWWSQRFNARGRGIGWRLDYFLIWREMRSRVRSAEIHDAIEGSDHCPVSLELSD